MMFSGLLNRPITIRSTGLEERMDEYGNPVEPTETVVEDAAYLEQFKSWEITEGAEVAQANWLMVLHKEVPVTPWDEIYVEDLGVTFEVVGEPINAFRPATGFHHKELRLAIKNIDITADAYKGHTGG